MRNLVLGAVALLVSLAAYPAMAGNVHFTLTDNRFGSSLSWALPASPLPDFADDEGFDVDGPVFGGAQDPDLGDGLAFLFGFTFFTGGDVFGGGLQFSGAVFFPDLSGDAFPFSVNALGDQLFTGTTDAPTFRLGTFQLTDDNSGGDCGCGPQVTAAVASDYTLNISGGVPEPATWALMIAGLGATGGALRRRRALAA
jgi:hypothetical protein